MNFAENARRMQGKLKKTNATSHDLYLFYLEH